MTLVDLIGWTATILGTTLGIPQLVRLVRTANVEGLSLIGWQSLLGLNIAWTFHGIAIGQLPQLLTNILALCSTVPILVLMSRVLGRRVALTLLPGFLLGLVMVGLDRYLGSLAFGIFAILPSIVVSAGQSLELVRAEHVRGVSPLYLSLGVLNLSMWLAWGALVNDSGTVVAVAITLLVAVFNLVWYICRRFGLRAFLTPAPVPVPVTD